uniref:Enhancer of rudimentary homolog n=1 Tax=Ascaris lumbricoides TaxID=6252 RepID=A0A0M3I5T7_ASCLU
MSHTILLMQPTARHDSRSWTDFESLTECIEGVCQIFEENLKKLNPDSASITYDVQNLFDFIDRLADLSCLVWLILIYILLIA